MSEQAPQNGVPPTYDLLVATSGLPRLEARALLEAASGRTREWLIAHGDEAVPAGQARQFAELAGRRRDRGEPLAYLLGHREFHGRDFEVGAGVLIPRPETEQLVELALANAQAGARLLDLGTGSGCIALTLACERRDLSIVATDRSAQALAIARRNAARLCPDALANQRLVLRQGDWWQAIKDTERFELIVSNPPYIAAADPHLSLGDLRFEPPGALASGPDGLDALREICAQAPTHLVPGGTLMVEHGFDQGLPVRELMLAAGLIEAHTIRDAAGLERITVASRTTEA